MLHKTADWAFRALKGLVILQINNKRSENNMAAQDNQIKLMDPDQLSLELVEAQYALKETRGKSNAKSVLILVSGIELAGKGEAVKQLREWVDRGRNTAKS